MLPYPSPWLVWFSVARELTARHRRFPRANLCGEWMVLLTEETRLRQAALAYVMSRHGSSPKRTAPAAAAARRALPSRPPLSRADRRAAGLHDREAARSL